MTTPALDSVPWSSVLNRLLDHVDDLPGNASFYTRPQGLLGPLHVMLAVTAVQAGQARCAEAVSNSRLGTWLYDAARAAHRFLSLDPEPEWRFPAFTGWLRVDPQLPALPLLGLAAEHAERRRTPLLVTGGERLLEVIGGRTQRGITATIGSDTRPVDLIELRERSDRVWCHELAHVLDTADRDPVTSEAFADTLGAMLEATPPRDLAELDSLTYAAGLLIATVPTPEPAQPASTAGVRPRPTTGHDLPAPGLDSVMVLASLPLSLAEINSR